ncbi:MAG TPA: HD domain-containing protein [Candidatus Dormibacteraeota bacterium]|nr:HD domain-containing protein [Candidatus Dormibacteraeota bacterium]
MTTMVSLAGHPRDRAELAGRELVPGGSRFEEALILASRLHAEQARKSVPIPYIGHLLAVASLVIEDGGSEDEVVAALLHDAGEDQGGVPTVDMIRERFGPAVAGIVLGCSDTLELPKPAWRPRKEAYLAHLEEASPQVMRVSTADKLHNARAVLRDLRSEGPSVFDRFSAPPEGTLWYFTALAEVLGRRRPGPLSDELQRVVATLVDEAGDVS